MGPVSEPPKGCKDAPREDWTGAFLFLGGVEWGTGGREGQLNPREGEGEREYCIADANEGAWGCSGREGKGRGRERRREPQEGVLRTTGKIF